jgi:hypothetical protein
LGAARLLGVVVGLTSLGLGSLGCDAAPCVVANDRVGAKLASCGLAEQDVDTPSGAKLEQCSAKDAAILACQAGCYEAAECNVLEGAGGPAGNLFDLCLGDCVIDHS